jgi:alkylation response protein AidB-like acyl-CoA dehydrogenase
LKFVLDAEQRLFGETLHKLLTEAGTPGMIRSWAAGEHDRTLWAALAQAGVFALAVPERHDGAGPRPIELVTAMVELGRHAVPGPVVETLAAAALFEGIGDEELSAEWLPRLAAGHAVVSLVPPSAEEAPPCRALDADVADLVLLAEGEGLWSARPEGTLRRSIDPARRLFTVVPAAPLASDATYVTARIALQMHGAIGYTDEYDPSLWIRKARALHSAWGSPANHRARLMKALS